MRAPALVALFVCTVPLAACGGGSSGGSQNPPVNPTFTSAPLTIASEGTSYSYPLTASSADGGAITFTLTSAPGGATLSANTISWTPTHAESRTSNSFIVTATTAAGGTATQSWTVTPTGNVNITAVTTYWTPSGSINVSLQWLANLPYPAALVPQTDGSLLRLQGSSNPDNSFTIPSVPAGYYWLQINPNANYWTSTSDFDDGTDLLGGPGDTGPQTTTTFNENISGLDPSMGSTYNLLDIATDDRAVSQLPSILSVLPNSTTLNFSLPSNVPEDWSKISTLYVSEFDSITSGAFTGYVLGPALTLSNISFVNGGTNNINAALTASPSSSTPINITGSAWAALSANVGPSSPGPSFSDFAVYVQPYVSDRYALPQSIINGGPGLTLLLPSAPQSTGVIYAPTPYACQFSTGVNGFPSANLGLPALTADTNYGTVAYGDPYPSSWLRLFQYCQLTTVTLPRPGSTTIDTFYVSNKQTTALPSGPVAPILSPVQSPTLNGASLFTSATLNTTKVTISWTPPAIGQPFAYFVVVHELVTLSTGTTTYTGAGGYFTTKTSVEIPFLAAGNTYVFSILAAVDSKANLEKSPLRHNIPLAESGVISAPFVIASGATP